MVEIIAIRKWLLLVSLFLFVVGCSDKKDAADSVSTEPIEILLGSASLTVEENRQTIVLRSGASRFNEVSRVEVQIRNLSQTEQPVAWKGIAAEYHDTEGSYWVVYPKFTQAGQWMFDIMITPDDGEEVTQSLVVDVLPEPFGILAGMEAPHSENFVWNGDNQPDRITTDPTPNEVLYQMTIAEAVTNGKPSVIIFGTPGLCTRRLWNLCGTVIDGLDALVAIYGDRVNFLHIESYNLDTGKYVSAITEWGLKLTPWIYLVDTDGVVYTRFDAIVGNDELTPMLDALLAS